MGQHMNRIGTRRDKTASGYVTESARYKAQRCEGCPLRGSSFKARGNRIIEVTPPVKPIQTAGTGKVTLGRRHQA